MDATSYFVEILATILEKMNSELYDYLPTRGDNILLILSELIHGVSKIIDRKSSKYKASGDHHCRGCVCQNPNFLRYLQKQELKQDDAVFSQFIDVQRERDSGFESLTLSPFDTETDESDDGDGSHSEKADKLKDDTCCNGSENQFDEEDDDTRRLENDKPVIIAKTVTYSDVLKRHCAK